MPKPFAFACGAKSARMRRGRTIKSMDNLIRYCSNYPSVWVSFANKPLPSVVVMNWQTRQVVWHLLSGTFSKVVRP